jgi:hypothetical protein
MHHPLVACADASKYWRAIAHKHLYRIVILSSPIQAKLFLRSIIANPCLPLLISSFTLGDFDGALDEHGVRHSYKDDWSATSWDILARLAPVYHLGVSVTSLCPLPPQKRFYDMTCTCTKLLKGLKSLSLGHDYTVPHGFGSWIGIAAHTLERLRYDGYSIRLSAPHLRSLSINNIPLGNREALEALFEGDNRTGRASAEDLSLRILAE